MDRRVVAMDAALIHIDDRNFGWVYSATATIGLLLALLLPSSTKRVPPASRPKYIVLQVATLFGAIVGAKLAFLSGDLGWPVASVGWREVVFSGRSITGGLLGGFLLAEVLKIPLRYTELPNDWFATKLPLSIAVGRVGCVLAGCCRGVEGSYPISMVYSDGRPRFPAQLCELAFQVVAFGGAWLVFRRGLLRGRVFALYMLTYGLFRLFVESYRETPKLVGGVSVYQLLSLGLAVTGVGSLIWYSRASLHRSV
ncbi:MAG: prolipoprotein diacylglyceryl transferase family protein [Polyangiaceae bacterium]